jgi:hypothetical protein
VATVSGTNPLPPLFLFADVTTQIFCGGDGRRRPRRGVPLVGGEGMGSTHRGGAVICPSMHPSRLRSVRTDPSALLLLAQVMPFIIPLTYFFLLPRPSTFASLPASSYDDEIEENIVPIPYAPIPTSESDANGEEQGSFPPAPKHIALSVQDKWRLVKPLFWKYMLPLCKLPFSSLVHAFSADCSR